MMKRSIALGLALLLAGCRSTETGETPTVSITSPQAGEVQNNTTVSVQATAAARVDAYVRLPQSKDIGRYIGGSRSAPYQFGWTTLDYPNALRAELYAEVTTAGGRKVQSDPVQVTISNAGTPELTDLIAISYPLPGLGSAGLGHQSRPDIDVRRVRAPESLIPVQSVVSRPGAQSQGNRANDLEWAWGAVDGADGYGVFLSTSALGPYTRQVSQKAAQGTQGFATSVNGEVGTQYFGTVTTIRGSAESGLSNMDGTTILPEPSLASPSEGQVVGDGKPILTWLPTPGAVAYLYYVYTQDPESGSPRAIWTNYPNPQTALTTIYPDRDKDAPVALPPGVYYWRVAAVAFNERRHPDSFSFSRVQRFRVP